MKNNVDPDLTSCEIKNVINPYTRFGKFLRKTSLDETLQLFNVFIGNMAFIGPRPLINKDQDSITIELRKKCGAIQLTPGISGYAQINGRIDVTPEEKAALDEFYYKHFSFFLDAKIFIVTILQSFHLRKNTCLNQCKNQ